MNEEFISAEEYQRSQSYLDHSMEKIFEKVNETALTVTRIDTTVKMHDKLLWIVVTTVVALMVGGIWAVAFKGDSKATAVELSEVKELQRAIIALPDAILSALESVPDRPPKKGHSEAPPVVPDQVAQQRMDAPTKGQAQPMQLGFPAWVHGATEAPQ